MLLLVLGVKCWCNFVVLLRNGRYIHQDCRSETAFKNTKSKAALELNVLKEMRTSNGRKSLIYKQLESTIYLFMIQNTIQLV